MNNLSRFIDNHRCEQSGSTGLTMLLAKLETALVRVFRRTDKALWDYTEAQSAVDTSSFDGLL